MSRVQSAYKEVRAAVEEAANRRPTLPKVVRSRLWEAVGHLHDAIHEEAPDARLQRIARIIEAVDNRCMAVDGPVTPTLKEMTQEEISAIYALATGQEQ